MPAPILYDPSKGLRGQSFLYCEGSLRESGATVRLHFRRETALTAEQQKQIELDAFNLPGISRAHIDTRSGHEYVLVVETGISLTADQISTLERELQDRCDFHYTTNATAEVVRNSHGHHVGTLVTLEFKGGPSPDLTTLDVLKRSSVGTARLNGSTLVVSMRHPSRDDARIQDFARDVADDANAYLTGLYEVTDDPRYSMLSELDWRPRGYGRDSDEEREEDEEK